MDKKWKWVLPEKDGKSLDLQIDCMGREYHAKGKLGIVVAVGS